MEKLSLASAQNFTQRYHSHYPLMSEPVHGEREKTNKTLQQYGAIISLEPLTTVEHNDMTLQLNRFNQ